MIPCEVFPSRTATSVKLQQLGQVLQAFFALEAPLPDASFGERENDAVNDLIQG